MAHFDLLPDTCSDISVTQTGIVQMLEIGRYLGRRYFDKLGSCFNFFYLPAVSLTSGITTKGNAHLCSGTDIDSIRDVGAPLQAKRIASGIQFAE